LVERLEFGMLFRWFVGLSIDEKVFDASTFSKNRDPMLTHEIAQGFLSSSHRGTAASRRIPGLLRQPCRPGVPPLQRMERHWRSIEPLAQPDYLREVGKGPRTGSGKPRSLPLENLYPDRRA
jgi:hypothetical protein